MIRTVFILAAFVAVMSSCRSTRKIQTVVTTRDTTTVATNPANLPTRSDTIAFMNDTYKSIQSNNIEFNTFSAKIDVDYEDGAGKKFNVNAHVRMQKDSVIWISITAIFGIEGLRAYITPDSVKILNKQDKQYTVHSLEYLQEMTALPLDLPTLQDLLVGNPVYFSSNIVSYNQTEDAITLLSLGDFFKNLISVSKSDKRLISIKLDDIDSLRNRTCFLTYGGYENKKGMFFPTRRQVTVTEKKKLDIKLNYKQYDFNETLSFPFSVPKNYQVN